MWARLLRLNTQCFLKVFPRYLTQIKKHIAETAELLYGVSTFVEDTLPVFAEVPLKKKMERFYESADSIEFSVLIQYFSV